MRRAVLTAPCRCRHSRHADTHSRRFSRPDMPRTKYRCHSCRLASRSMRTMQARLAGPHAKPALQASAAPARDGAQVPEPESLQRGYRYGYRIPSCA
jgi:hypothetical protein